MDVNKLRDAAAELRAESARMLHAADQLDAIAAQTNTFCIPFGEERVLNLRQQERSNMFCPAARPIAASADPKTS